MDFSRKNTQLFVALMPLVCGATVVLLPWSAVGLLVFIGVFGLLGLIGLIWSWLGLWFNQMASTAQLFRIILLSVGLIAAMFGVTGFGVLGKTGHPSTIMPIFLLAQWSVIYGVLAVFFLFSGSDSDTENTEYANPRSRRHHFIVVSWIISVAIGIVPYYWIEARVKTDFDNSEPEVKARDFRESVFANAFCRDDLHEAARALIKPHAIPNEEILLRSISECSYPRWSPNKSGQESLKKEKARIALDAIVTYEKEHPVLQIERCTKLRRVFLAKAFSDADFESLELFESKGFTLHCRNEYAPSNEPLWFSVVTSDVKPLTVERLKRLQAMGIDLNERDASGKPFLTWWIAKESPPEVVDFLAQLGVVAPRPQ